MKFIKNLHQYKGLKTGILTNHTGYDIKDGYHFISLQKELKIVRLFIPEHGLFAELQDQMSGSGLQYFNQDLEFCNLYGDTESSLIPTDSKLLDLDLVVIDIRDVGARYYTFLTTAYYILEKLSELKVNFNVPEVVVLDSPNPIGKKVEGSPLKKIYSSFVGVEGVLHRHGLSPGGLLSYYNESRNLNLVLNIIKPGIYHPKKYKHLTWIPPSPNIPSLTTCFVYPGQCLLEGTNLSEGRGTTRPFEIFGSPYINIEDTKFLSELKNPYESTYHLRPLRYVPTFHKFKNEICNGFQIIVLDSKKFHSLFFTLFMLRQLLKLYPESFKFLAGVYEYRSDRPAIELLVGDPFLLNYIHGSIPDKECLDYLKEEEKIWKIKIQDYQY
jgi:uncharacterized protein YbbC (DUF1343 family)